MQDPLKQGLKLFLSKMGKWRINDSNARSTKTRIETCSSSNPDNRCYFIRMQDPLKQGLKPRKFVSSAVTKFNSNARSTKTRIETNFERRIIFLISRIRMQDPLKQGLKPAAESAPTAAFSFECKIH